MLSMKKSVLNVQQCFKLFSQHPRISSFSLQSQRFFQKKNAHVVVQPAQRYSSLIKGLIFRQLFHGDTFTYTYILGCPHTRQAVIIDPVDDMVERDLKLANEMELNLIYGMNTHVHADHVTGTANIKERLSNLKSVISKASGAVADIHLHHGDKLSFGEQEIECLSTPGHTNGCMTYVLPKHDIAFTGDAVLIRSCGRTDFQEGDPEQLYQSVHQHIFTLPDHFALYPGHDYQGFSASSVGEEKLLNTRLTLPKDKFIQFMNNLNLAYPRLIDVSVPANLKCGKVSQEAFFDSENLLGKKLPDS